jgi:hypothetical protein
MAIPNPYTSLDYCKFFVTCDGVNYYSMGRRSHGMCEGDWDGDFGQCDGWHWRPYNGYDVTDWCPYDEITHVGVLWVMYTDDDGCGPGGAGDAGAMIDDVWFAIEVLNPVEEMSWGLIKAMFR